MRGLRILGYSILMIFLDRLILLLVILFMSNIGTLLLLGWRWNLLLLLKVSPNSKLLSLHLLLLGPVKVVVSRYTKLVLVFMTRMQLGYQRLIEFALLVIISLP